MSVGTVRKRQLQVHIDGCISFSSRMCKYAIHWITSLTGQSLFLRILALVFDVAQTWVPCTKRRCSNEQPPKSSLEPEPGTWRREHGQLNAETWGIAELKVPDDGGMILASIAIRTGLDLSPPRRYQEHFRRSGAVPQFGKSLERPPQTAKPGCSQTGTVATQLPAVRMKALCVRACRCS
jgi:hypothetical protein